MAQFMNLELTEELQRYLESRTGDSDLYTSPDEFVRDLIRRSMEEWKTVNDVAEGLREARDGNFAPESILDILRES